MNESARQPRAVAVRTTVGEIVAGTYVQEENQNYVLTVRQEKLLRVNVLAIVLGKEEAGTIMTILLDDGTGQIALRSFEQNKSIAAVQAGDIIMILGKIRMYNQEKYLSPEIVRKVPPAWLKVRKEELRELFEKTPPPERGAELISSEGQMKPDNSLPHDFLPHDFPGQKIRQLITELDQGQGALMEDLLERSALPETEARLKKMLEEGEIFQNLPGRVKVL